MNTISGLMTDFGIVPLDKQFEGLPKRKDGQPDLRYKASRSWFNAKYQQALNDYMTSAETFNRVVLGNALLSTYR